MGLYASRGYLDRHGRPTKPSDLKDHYHVGFDESMSTHPGVQKLERNFVTERIVHRSSSFVGQLSATLAGIGIGAHDCVLADAEPTLERLLPDVFRHEVEIWLVTHADLRRSARIRAVFDFLSDVIAADRTTLTGGAPVMGNAA